jgi:hypothetical protein
MRRVILLVLVVLLTGCGPAFETRECDTDTRIVSAKFWRNEVRQAMFSVEFDNDSGGTVTYLTAILSNDEDETIFEVFPERECLDGETCVWSKEFYPDVIDVEVITEYSFVSNADEYDGAGEGVRCHVRVDTSDL